MNDLIKKVEEWAKSEQDIVALALVGSHARGTARDNSDIDFVVITTNPSNYLKDEWVKQFGEIKKLQDEDYGLVQSKRVFYSDGSEVEFGITTTEWAKTNPIDGGTKKVVMDGIKILYDREGLLDKLLKDLKSGM